MRYLVALCLMLASGLVVGNTIDGLTPVETLSVDYKGYKKPVLFNVTLPQSYREKPEKQYVVLFDLHPRSQPMLSGLHDWMSHNGEWPWLETIIVTKADYHAEFGESFNAMVDDPANQTMLNILETTLNEVDKKYRTNGFRIYSGFMGNAAYGAYTLLNRPALFDGYILATPSLGNNFGHVVSDAAKKLPGLTDKIRFLYIAIGEHGYEKGSIDAVKQFNAALEQHAPDTLDWHVDMGLKQYYMSRPVMAVVKGIEAIFDDIHQHLPADSAISRQGPDAIVAYYKRLSDKKYGFEVTAEGSLKNLAKATFEVDQEKGLAIYRQTATLYPTSAYAQSAMADALAEMGRIQEAIAYQQKAVANAETMIEWHQRNHAKKLAALKNKLDL